MCVNCTGGLFWMNIWNWTGKLSVCKLLQWLHDTKEDGQPWFPLTIQSTIKYQACNLPED